MSTSEHIVLDAMERASSAFYRDAQRTGCHAFIELTGLINEYIRMCEDRLRSGGSFLQLNVHTGEHLPLPRYREAYIAEKLECIYGRTAFRPKGVDDDE